MKNKTFLELCYKVAEAYDDCSNQDEFEEMVGNIYQEYFGNKVDTTPKPHFDLTALIKDNQ